MSGGAEVESTAATSCPGGDGKSWPVTRTVAPNGTLSHVPAPEDEHGLTEPDGTPSASTWCASSRTSTSSLNRP